MAVSYVLGSSDEEEEDENQVFEPFCLEHIPCVISSFITVLAQIRDLLELIVDGLYEPAEGPVSPDAQVS